MIDDKQISFIVQGASDVQITPACMRSIRRFYPNSRIIFSTWAGTDLKDIDCDEAVLSVDPGHTGNVFFPNDRLKRSHYNNLNRQICSTISGLEMATTEYAVKFRSDFTFRNDSLRTFYGYLDEIELKSDPRWQMFTQRILTIPVANVDNLQMAYHFGDLVQIGKTNDLKALWEIPLLSKEEAQFCLLNAHYFQKRPRTYRYACEQEIWMRCLEKHHIEYRRPDYYYSVDKGLIDQTKASFVNNLFWIELGALGISTKFKWLETNNNKYAYGIMDFYELYATYLGENPTLFKICKKINASRSQGN